MKSKDKIRDPLPETFATAEEAGEFWDTHSTSDYEEDLETEDNEIEIQQRIYEVPIEADVFQQLQREARSLHESVPEFVDHLLRERLVMTEPR